MDQGEGQTDRHTGEADGSQAVGGAQDDQQEDEGEHQLGEQSGPEAITTGGVGTPAVGGQGIAATEGEAFTTTGDAVDQATGGEGAQHLGHHVGQHLGTGELASRPEPEGHGGVDVASGDVTDRVGGSQQGETEGEGNAEEAEAKRVGGGVVIGEHGSQHGTAAATEHEPEGTDEFGKKLLGNGNSESHAVEGRKGKAAPF